MLTAGLRLEDKATDERIRVVHPPRHLLANLSQYRVHSRMIPVSSAVDIKTPSNPL